MLPPLSYPAQRLSQLLSWPNSIPLVILDQLILMYKTLWMLVKLSVRNSSVASDRKTNPNSRDQTAGQGQESVISHLTRRPKEGELS